MPGIPPFEPLRLLTETRLDPLITAVLLLAAGLYFWGVRRLAERGVSWSRGRQISWYLGGLGTVAIATLSGLAAYDTVLFSAHMVQHMLLAMVAPIFLALGAPITLALRVLPLGGRSALMAVLHSRLAKIATFPAVGWLLFVASPFALYFTGWYPATLDNALLHELLHAHFVLVGALFFWPLIGVDPVPGRVPHPMRVLLLVTTLPIHVILGLTIMSERTVIATDHYSSLGLPWIEPLLDQRVGGGLLWASGDLIGLLMLGAAVVQWKRASEREAEREDRRLDRLEEQASRRAAQQVTDAGGSPR
ncbi:MAG: cytochrome c oxidase assembly protein [Actinomycetota bacterium]|nr:cytochrome c oxidase assembly protein [Actinomycetota bacterium]